MTSGCVFQKKAGDVCSEFTPVLFSCFCTRFTSTKRGSIFGKKGDEICFDLALCSKLFPLSEENTKEEMVEDTREVSS